MLHDTLGCRIKFHCYVNEVIDLRYYYMKRIIQGFNAKLLCCLDLLDFYQENCGQR